MKIVIKRRPECARQGDERGKVWYHRYSWLERAFDRAPKLTQKLTCNAPELTNT
ncbi:hypothetical protein HOV55_gp49 [Erwinia phage vB_EhrS_59]|uniref:Uncharacterized protein n=1 Tax=Erwinia phage vB_EhrS_59 TaxID=2283025 RepID=A0A4Y1NRI1_9CAUD|nr:hypothetical protein HOV55_gp49 [Erwinia phage vB_EhrS_59]AXH43567.1 hypothetical protein MZUP2_490 [Erwinia phage vB_EhrS_59]